MINIHDLDKFHSVSQSCEDDLAYCACLKEKGKCASDVETRGACAKTCNACGKCCTRITADLYDSECYQPLVVQQPFNTSTKSFYSKKNMLRTYRETATIMLETLFWSRKHKFKLFALDIYLGGSPKITSPPVYSEHESAVITIIIIIIQ